jgi:hypothetical protein
MPVLALELQFESRTERAFLIEVAKKPPSAGSTRDVREPQPSGEYTNFSGGHEPVAKARTGQPVPSTAATRRAGWHSQGSCSRAEDSGEVSGTVEHSQDERAHVEGLENDQVVSMCADPYRVAQVGTRHIAMRPIGNLLAVLPNLLNE